MLILQFHHVIGKLLQQAVNEFGDGIDGIVNDLFGFGGHSSSSNGDVVRDSQDKGQGTSNAGQHSKERDENAILLKIFSLHECHEVLRQMRKELVTCTLIFLACERRTSDDERTDHLSGTILYNQEGLFQRNPTCEGVIIHREQTQ